MAGQSWSINVVPSDGGISLNPDVWGVDAGAPLQAEVGDLVSWNNQTDGDSQIVVSGETLDAKAWQSTTAHEIQNPNNIPTPYSITYTCSSVSGDQSGQIDVLS